MPNSVTGRMYEFRFACILIELAIIVVATTVVLVGDFAKGWLYAAVIVGCVADALFFSSPIARRLFR